MRAFLAVVLACVFCSSAAKATCPSPGADQVVRLTGRPFAAEPAADNCRLFVSLMVAREGGAVAVLANDNGVFRVARSVTVRHGSGGGLSLSHDGAVFAVAAEDAILLYDVAKLESADQDPLIAELPVNGHGAIYTAFGRDDALLFVAEERNASIAVIDVAAAKAGKGGKAIVARIGVGQAPVGLAVSPDGTRLYSTSEVLGQGSDCRAEQANGRAHAQGALLAIDTAKAASDPQHAVVGAVRAGCNPVRVVISADGRTLWISQRGDDRVWGLNPAQLTRAENPGPTKGVTVGKSPVGLALRPDGQQLWIANSDRFAGAAGTLSLVSPATPADAKLANTLPVGAFPRDLRFLPDGRTLVIALFGAGAVMLHPTP